MKKDILLFRFSCVLFGISSFSILLSIIGDYKGDSIAVLFAILTGILFWSGLILGVVSILLVNQHRKRFEKRKSINYRKKQHRVGAISFFNNKPAAIADIALVVLLIIILAAMFIPVISQNITIIFLAFLLLSVYMHCMLNGVNFIYIKSIEEECKK